MARQAKTNRRRTAFRRPRAPLLARLRGRVEASIEGLKQMELGPLGTAILLMLPVVAAALFFVWTHITTVQLGYSLTEASETHAALVEKNRGLSLEVAALKAPERLKRLALHRGLEAPQPSQVVRLSTPHVALSKAGGSE